MLKNFYDQYIQEEFIEINNLKSNSINVIDLDKICLINDIQLEINNTFYELPPLIKNKAEEIFKLIKFENFNYNGKTFRLIDFTVKNNVLILKVEKSDYISFLITNKNPDLVFFNQLTIRDYLEPLISETFTPFIFSQAENHFGVSALIINEKEEVLIPISNIDKDFINSSISGAANIHSSLKNNICSVKNILESEIYEEIFCFNNENIFTKKEEELLDDLTNNTTFIGFSRNLHLLGKPELFFKIDINKDQENLLKKITNTKSNFSEIIEIDKQENLKFLWIPLKNFEKNVIKNENTGEFNIFLDDKTYILSESLISNIFYLNNYLKNKNFVETNQNFVETNSNFIGTINSNFVVSTNSLIKAKNDKLFYNNKIAIVYYSETLKELENEGSITLNVVDNTNFFSMYTVTVIDDYFLKNVKTVEKILNTLTCKDCL